MGWLRKNYRWFDQSSYWLHRSEATVIHRALDVRNEAIVINDRATTFGPWMLDFEISVASDSRTLFA